MVTKRELASKSVEDLEKVVAGLDADIEKLRDEKRKAARALEAKVEGDAAVRVVEGMSGSQREALAQAIKTAPVDGEASVGTPGGEG